MSRDLSQGNVPRAWSSLLALLDSYEIFSEETLKLEKHTHVRRVLKAVAEEVIRPGLKGLPDEIVERCVELGFDVRPVSEQLGIPRGKRDPLAFDPEAGRPEIVDVTLTGSQLGASMAAAGSNGDEAAFNK